MNDWNQPVAYMRRSSIYLSGGAMDNQVARRHVNQVVETIQSVIAGVGIVVGVILLGFMLIV